jgi:hypothetical protein
MFRVSELSNLWPAAHAPLQAPLYAPLPPPVNPPSSIVKRIRPVNIIYPVDPVNLSIN